MGHPPLFHPFLFAFLLSLKLFAFALSLHRTEKLATQAKDALDSLSFYYTWYNVLNDWVSDWLIDWLIDFRLKLQTLMSWMKSTYKTKSTPEGISLGRSLPSPQSQLGVEDLGGSIILQGRGLVRNDSPEKGTRTTTLVFFFYHRGLIRNRLSFSTYIYWMKHKFGTVIFADTILLQFSEEKILEQNIW